MHKIYHQIHYKLPRGMYDMQWYRFFVQTHSKHLQNYGFIISCFHNIMLQSNIAQHILTIFLEKQRQCLD